MAGEFASLNLQDDRVFVAELWQAAWRRQARELADAFGLLAMGEAEDGDAVVLGGFTAAKVSGQPRLEITRGVAFLFDPDTAPPASPYTLLRLPYNATEPPDDSLTPATFAAGSGQPRVDLVYIVSADVTDRASLVVEIVDPSTDPPATDTDTVNTQRAAATTVGVVAGTPDASPVPDYGSLPAGAVALWEVLVPASGSDSDTYTLTDVRPMRARRFWQNKGVQIGGPASVGTLLVSGTSGTGLGQVGVGVSHVDDADIGFSFLDSMVTPEKGQTVHTMRVSYTVYQFVSGTANVRPFVYHSETGTLEALGAAVTLPDITTDVTVPALLAVPLTAPYELQPGDVLMMRFNADFETDDAFTAVHWYSWGIEVEEGQTP